MVKKNYTKHYKRQKIVENRDHPYLEGTWQTEDQLKEIKMLPGQSVF